MNEYATAAIRHGLAGLGVYLVNHGLTTQADGQAIAGGAMALVMLLWSLWQKKHVRALKAQLPPPAGAVASQQLGSSSGLGAGLPLLLALGLVLGAIGCTHSTLEPGGAYAPADTNGVASAAPDFDLFVVDSAFGLAHDAVDAVFAFERTNRATLWQISPKIKHGLDQARGVMRQADHQFAMARLTYLANPIPANLTTLQQLLAQAQQLAAAAQTVLASQGATVPAVLPTALPSAPAPAH